ncbi:hypothetical protein K474DRAFT_1658047 [Panus rudis PR-1116 ss-1]|nr:hypothetical protein K474DRAFT_1658047 [Panus rudis PR-1116 ss-1]
MSDRTARQHQNRSKRIQQGSTSDRKLVYRSVLDNPLRTSWPNVPVNLQNLILARSISVLDGVSQYQRLKRAHARKTKKSKGGQNNQRTLDDLEHTSIPDGIADPPSAIPASSSAGSSAAAAAAAASSPPDILSHLIVGVNAVTKRLEAMAKNTKHLTSATGASASEPTVRHGSLLVLSCRDDLNPPILQQHIPDLVSACNNVRRGDQSGETPAVAWLVALPKGSEETLSEAVGLRRTSVIAIDSTAPRFAELQALLTDVPLLHAPWQDASKGFRSLEPTHIKQLRTTAPKNMKEAKEKRKAAKLAAKARQRERKADTRKQARKTSKLILSTASLPA